MKKILACSLFYLLFIIACNKQIQYSEAVIIVKNCYATIHNSNTYNDYSEYYGFSKKTIKCSACNQMSLISIEFVYDYIDSKGFQSEETLVNTCKNQDCKYFALYKIPLHERQVEVKQLCLYKGKFDKLEDVLLEDTI